MSLHLADRVSFRKMSEMVRVDFGLPIANVRFVRFASDERFALENSETFHLKVTTVITGVARGKYVSGANHMGANKAVPTIWDPDYMV